MLASGGFWGTIPAAMAKKKAKKASRKSRSSRKASAANHHAKLPKNGVTLIVLMRARTGHEPFLEAELRALGVKKSAASLSWIGIKVRK